MSQHAKPDHFMCDQEFCRHINNCTAQPGGREAVGSRAKFPADYACCRGASQSEKLIRKVEPSVPPSVHSHPDSSILSDDIDVGLDQRVLNELYPGLACSRFPRLEPGSENLECFQPEREYVIGLFQMIRCPVSNHLPGGVEYDRIAEKRGRRA